jgi:uncharacterized membrane protein YcaP (DUF421 family)
LLAYPALILLLRVSGKRTLSKMNAFDLIVTVALGSTLATVLISPQVSLAQGVLAFAMLIGLQFVITWLSVRSKRASDMVKAEPRLLLFRGAWLHQALLEERVTVDEGEAALRAEGVNSASEAHSVVLETDGSFSVVPKSRQ